MTFLLFGFFAFSSFANNPSPATSTTLTKQFQKLLKGIEVSDLQSEVTIYVDFILNDKSEIIVVSTSEDGFDKVIKNRLNYKTIESGSLDYGTKYTLPVSLKK